MWRVGLFCGLCLMSWWWCWLPSLSTLCNRTDSLTYLHFFRPHFSETDTRLLFFSVRSIAIVVVVQCLKAFERPFFLWRLSEHWLTIKKKSVQVIASELSERYSWVLYTSVWTGDRIPSAMLLRLPIEASLHSRPSVSAVLPVLAVSAHLDTHW